MSGIQCFTASGRLGADVKVKELINGPLGSFDLFVKERYKTSKGEKKENLEIFKVNVWGDRIFGMQHLLKKGSLVSIRGKLRTRSTVNQETGLDNKYIVVDAEEISILFVKDSSLNMEQYDE